MGCSTTVGRALARIEQLGIPTFSISVTDHAAMVTDAFRGMGLPADAAQYEFPAEVFFAGSDLSPLAQNIDKIIDGLTRWKPKTQVGPPQAPATVTVDGKDQLQALDKMNALFLENRWTDGLPVMPPTEERVNWLLTGTDLAPGTVVGRVLPRGETATVKLIAANLAMAGGRPEYMPVLIAAIQGLTDPLMRLQMSQVMEGSVCPVVIVNGPMGKQIHINSGHGCLGPDPLHPAGGIIGRAVKLSLQNIGGAICSSGPKSTHVGPSRYATLVFAEDEDGLPPGWEPLNRERGFPAGSNVVTVYAVASIAQLNSPKVTTEKLALDSLNRLARIMSADYGNIFSSANDEKVPGIALMPLGMAQGLASIGWSKEKVRDYLWEHTKIPLSVVKSDYYFAEHTAPYRYTRKPGAWPLLPEGQPWTIAPSAKNIMIAIAGGNDSLHGHWMRVACCPFAPVSVEARQPAGWKGLLDRASERQPQ